MPSAAGENGKDFVAGFVVVGCFAICAIKNVQCKMLTSSATEKHLGNLWGEIDFFLRTSKASLLDGKGGRIIYHSGGQYMSRRGNGAEVEKNSYVMAAVVTSDHKGEGLSGHHAPWNLFVADEISGMANVAYSMAQGWAKHMLLIGNPFPCGADHFFQKGVKGGDIRSPEAG